MMRILGVSLFSILFLTLLCTGCISWEKRPQSHSGKIVSPKKMPSADDVLQAVRDEDTQALALILEKVPSLADVKDQYGYPLLHIAIWKDNARIVKILLGYKASPDAKSPYGFSPLHETVRCDESNDRKEIIEMLIVRRADINALTPAGNTPLDIAEIYERQDFARVLRYYGAKRIKQTVDLPPAPPFAPKNTDIDEVEINEN